MKEIWTGRVGQVAAKYGEHAPVASACCNACRACITSNAIAVATAALAGVGAGITRAARRYFAKPNYY